MRVVLVVFLLSLASFQVSDVSPASAQNNGDQKQGMALDAMRLLQQHDTEAAATGPTEQDIFLAPTPRANITNDVITQFLHSGEPVLHGIMVRKSYVKPENRQPYFEGTFKREYHPFLGQTLVTFDEGVYAIPGDAAYIGTFTYFGGSDNVSTGMAGATGGFGNSGLAIGQATKGSFVLVGKKVLWDGTSEDGIFIAEDTYQGQELNLIKATPDYLNQFQQRHAAAVQAYRSQPADSGDDDFGMLLALGLGAALIGGSDLPSFDKLALAEAFITDVAGDGDGTAMMDMALNAFSGQNDMGGLFSGTHSFQAPGLESVLSGILTGEATGGGTASTTPGPASQSPPQTALPQSGQGQAQGGSIQSARSQGGSGQQNQTAQASPSGGSLNSSALTSETFSFSCPAGGNYSIPVAYRNPTCGEAMKNFARTYACNQFDDFDAAGQRCQRDCGHPQCAEQ